MIYNIILKLVHFAITFESSLKRGHCHEKDFSCPVASYDFIFYFFPGCTTSGEDKQIIQSVIELEKNEYLLKTLQITFDDYSRNIKSLFFSDYDYLDKYDSKELYVKIKTF